MAAYTLRPEEKEVHITWSVADKTARIFTSDPVTLRKLDALVEACPDSYRILKEEDWNGNRTATYCVSSKLISFRKPRTFSDEQRKAAAERMIAIRKC